MIISHKINQHLDRLEEHLVEAVQGDSGRELAMHLYYQNATWTPPEGTKALVRYASDQGYGGCYDTLPDGTAAWSIAENVLTVRLVPQVLAVPGIARMQVLLRHGEEAVATFSVLIRVQADPSADAMEPDGYVNLSQWIAEEVATQVTDAVFLTSGNENITGLQIYVKISCPAANGKGLTQVQAQIDGIQMTHLSALHMPLQRAFIRAQKEHFISKAVFLGNNLPPFIGQESVQFGELFENCRFSGDAISDFPEVVHSIRGVLIGTCEKQGVKLNLGSRNGNDFS